MMRNRKMEKKTFQADAVLEKCNRVIKTCFDYEMQYSASRTSVIATNYDRAT